MNNEYQQFLSKNNKRLTDEGVFKVLAKYYNTDQIDKWDNDLDENLISKINDGDVEAFRRYNEIKKANKNEIEQHKFEQFIATKQIKVFYFIYCIVFRFFCVNNYFSSYKLKFV